MEKNTSLSKKKMPVALLVAIPLVFNLIISGVLLVISPGPVFSGYIAGTLICAILSFLWAYQIRRADNANFIVLLKLTLGGFLLKILLLFVILFGIYPLINIDRVAFAAAFLLGTMMSMGIELMFFFRLLSSLRRNKDGN